MVNMRKLKARNFVTGRWVLIVKLIKRETSSSVRLAGYYVVSKINRRTTNRSIHPLLHDQAAAWRAN